jgi:hypothetical protein
MAPRKPPGISFESFAEIQIRKAREEGFFDDLPGKGKPLENLRDAYDPLWWAKKMVKREGVSVLPASLAIRKTVESEMKRIETLPSEAKVREAVGELNEKIRAANRASVSGPPSTQSVLDAEAVLARWRKARG